MSICLLIFLLLIFFYFMYQKNFGCIMGVQWAYNGRTNELFTSEYLSEAPKGLKYHNLIINIGVLFYHTHLITPHRAL